MMIFRNHHLSPEIDDVKKEMKNICNVEIVTEKHYVDMYEREIDINTKLYKDLRKKNKALFITCVLVCLSTLHLFRATTIIEYKNSSF